MEKLASLTLSLLICMLLLAIALQINSLEFEPLIGIGPREVAHLIGFTSSVLGLWLFLIFAVNVYAACVRLLFLITKKAGSTALSMKIVGWLVLKGCTSNKALALSSMGINYSCLFTLSLFASPL